MEKPELRAKKTRQVMNKAKSLLITLFNTTGIVQKEFVLAGQTDNHAHYCDVSW
jgi:hypothetical protein